MLLAKGEPGVHEVLVDADSKVILGAAIFGTRRDEVIHCVLDMMYARAPYRVSQRAMHFHPTVSETDSHRARRIASSSMVIQTILSICRRTTRRSKSGAGRAAAMGMISYFTSQSRWCPRTFIVAQLSSNPRD